MKEQRQQARTRSILVYSQATDDEAVAEAKVKKYDLELPARHGI